MPIASRFLADVLEQSEHIQQLIEQSAEELSWVDIEGAPPLAGSDPALRGRSALETREVVTGRLHDASARLGAVNRALQVEIRDRTMVDHQLAAAVEQELASRHAALHDPLTGLPNRVLFNDRLEHGIAHARRRGWILAVMFVDLDKFKGINDVHGHQAGDAVLKTVAMRLANETRQDDTISRYGGDEFLCLLTPVHAEDDVAFIAAKILKAIQAPLEVQVGDVILNLAIQASIGVSVFPKDGATAAALIACADFAMYEAKEDGAGVAFAH